MGRNLAAKENKGSHPADMHAEKSSATKPIGVTRVNICAALFSYSLPPDARQRGRRRDAIPQPYSTSPPISYRRHLCCPGAPPLLPLAISLLFHGICNDWLAATSACATIFPSHGVSQFTCQSCFPVCFLDLMLKFAPLLACVDF